MDHCLDCQTELPPRKSPHSRPKRCPPCNKTIKKVRQDAHRAAYPELWKEYGRRSDRKRVGTPKRRRSARRSHLKKLYGITLADWDRMFAEQNGKCAICFTESAAEVDHHHMTNAVRGLLCGRCNRAIGSLRDDPDIAASACRYLSKHEGS